MRNMNINKLEYVYLGDVLTYLEDVKESLSLLGVSEDKTNELGLFIGLLTEYGSKNDYPSLQELKDKLLSEVEDNEQI